MSLKLGHIGGNNRLNVHNIAVDARLGGMMTCDLAAFNADLSRNLLMARCSSIAGCLRSRDDGTLLLLWRPHGFAPVGL